MSKKNQHLVHLLTEAGEALQADPTAIPWNTYPRPQMRRDSFYCLNGEWAFENGADAPTHIRVPFCPESLLSGLCMPPAAVTAKMYSKTFTLPEGFVRGRVILHFGAVNSSATVWLNHHCLKGRGHFEQGCDFNHVGGYESFSYDITEYLQDENLLTVFTGNPL